MNKIRRQTPRIAISGREISRIDIHGIGKSFYQHRGVADPRSLQEHRSPRDAMRGRNCECSGFNLGNLKLKSTRFQRKLTRLFQVFRPTLTSSIMSLLDGIKRQDDGKG